MSLANKIRLIKAARKIGLSDAEILREVLAGEYGSERRRGLVVEWGELRGLPRAKRCGSPTLPDCSRALTRPSASRLERLAIKLGKGFPDKKIVVRRGRGQLADLRDSLSAVQQTKTPINLRYQLFLRHEAILAPSSRHVYTRRLWLRRSAALNSS